MSELPRITEIYLMVRRPLRPSFSQVELETFLAALDRAMEYAMRYGRAQKFRSEALQRCETFQAEVNKMAQFVSGNPDHYQHKLRSFSSDGNEH